MDWMRKKEHQLVYNFSGLYEVKKMVNGWSEINIEVISTKSSLGGYHQKSSILNFSFMYLKDFQLYYVKNEKNYIKCDNFYSYIVYFSWDCV